jgi:hypothetical protein
MKDRIRQQGARQDARGENSGKAGNTRRVLDVSDRYGALDVRKISSPTCPKHTDSRRSSGFTGVTKITTFCLSAVGY